jgi:hypothetical protein
VVSESDECNMLMTRLVTDKSQCNNDLTAV